MDGDDDGRCQINKRPENPHQRSSKGLIFDRGHAEKIGRGDIRRIDKAISEAKKCTQCTTTGHHYERSPLIINNAPEVRRRANTMSFTLGTKPLPVKL